MKKKTEGKSYYPLSSQEKKTHVSHRFLEEQSEIVYSGFQAITPGQKCLCISEEAEFQGK